MSSVGAYSLQVNALITGPYLHCQLDRKGKDGPDREPSLSGEPLQHQSDSVDERHEAVDICR
jgi:hypothetical protein